VSQKGKQYLTSASLPEPRVGEGYNGKLVVVSPLSQRGLMLARWPRRAGGLEAHAHGRALGAADRSGMHTRAPYSLLSPSYQMDSGGGVVGASSAGSSSSAAGKVGGGSRRSILWRTRATKLVRSREAS